MAPIRRCSRRSTRRSVPGSAPIIRRPSSSPKRSGVTLRTRFRLNTRISATPIARWRAPTPAPAFPHRVLAGRDPWHGIRIQRAHVRRQLEHELMGKLVHLRQVYAAEWNNGKRLAEVIGGTRAGFLTMLRAVLRLAGRPVPPAPDALVREAASLIGFS